MRNKRLFLALLSGISALALASCGSGENTTTTIEENTYHEGDSSIKYANDLVVGDSYSKYEYKPYLSFDMFKRCFVSDNLFSNGNLYGEFECKNDDDSSINIERLVYHPNTFFAGIDSYKSYDTYRYSIYKMPVVFNMPYVSEVCGVSSNDGTQEAWIKWKETALAGDYETKAKEEFERTFENEIKEKESKNILFNEIPMLDKIKDSIPEKYTNKHPIQTDSFVDTFKDSWESGYYNFQRRATYNMYIILSFEVDYKKDTSSLYEGWWYREFYDYKRIESSYKYLGYSIEFELISDKGPAFIQYFQNENLLMDFSDLKYANKQKENYIYL